jgi:hypothetical protein
VSHIGIYSTTIYSIAFIFIDFFFFLRGSNLSRKDIGMSKLNTSNNDFSLLQVFCNTKLCNILFANELNRRLVKVSADVKCYSCHPGNLLPTYLFQKMMPIRFIRTFATIFMKSMVSVFLCY